MLNSVKTALRISHDYLNAEINDCIAEAKAEMIRAGVPETIANDESNELTARAIKTFCLSAFASDEKARESYQASFDYQVDNLRKSGVVNA